MAIASNLTRVDADSIPSTGKPIVAGSVTVYGMVLTGDNVNTIAIITDDDNVEILRLQASTNTSFVDDTVWLAPNGLKLGAGSTPADETLSLTIFHSNPFGSA